MQKYHRIEEPWSEYPNWVELARAIIRQAAEDIKYGPDWINAERFIRTPWCRVLCEYTEIDWKILKSLAIERRKKEMRRRRRMY